MSLVVVLADKCRQGATLHNLLGMCVEHLSRNFYRCSSNAIHCREPIGHIGSVDCSDSVDSGKPIDSGNFGTFGCSKQSANGDAAQR